MAKGDLTFHRIARAEGPMRGPRGHDGHPPRLMLFTPAGLGRTVPLTRDQLFKIAREALDAIADLDRMAVDRGDDGR